MWCVFAFLVSVSFQHICKNGDGQQQHAPPRARRGVDLTIKKKKKKYWVFGLGYIAYHNKKSKRALSV